MLFCGVPSLESLNVLDELSSGHVLLNGPKVSGKHLKKGNFTAYLTVHC